MINHLFSSSLLLCFCVRANSFTAPIPWYSSNKNAPGASTTTHSSTVVKNGAESPKEEVTPESEILHSILASKETTYNSLSDIRSYRSWDFSWPTITKPHRFTPRHTYASDRAFFATIQANNYGLPFDLLTAVGAFDEVNSVVLYGGALVDIVTKRDESIRDWDLRLIGEEYVQSPEKCIKAAKQFTRNVFTYLKKENERIQIANQENKRKRELQEPLFDIQEVNDEIRALLPSSSLGGSTVKDNVVVLDAAAKYTLESLCVVLDTDGFKKFYCPEATTDKSVKHISRAIKHFKKGFDIILPKLDMEKLPVRNLEFDQNEVLDLPQMTFIFDSHEDNKIMAGDVKLAKTSHRIQSGWNGYDAETTFDAAKFIHHNIRCLVGGVYDDFYFWAEGEVLDPIFDYAPLLTERMIDKAYETLKKNALSSGSVNVNKVQRYFSATSPAEVFDQILMGPLHDIDGKKCDSFPEPFEFDDKLIDTLIAKEKDALMQKLSAIRDVLQEKGLDNIVVDFPEHVFSEDEILKGLNGNYLLLDD